MSTSATTLKRKPRYRTQHSPLRWSDSVAARKSAAAVIRLAFPAGADYGVSKYTLSRARKDGGALAQVAEWMRAASPEGRRQMRAWLDQIVRSYERNDVCVRDALEAYADADLSEERIERTVWEKLTPERLREHMAAVRTERAAADRYLCVAEAWLAQQEMEAAS